MLLHELSPYQRDAIKEVGNIGAGNAAGALCQMVNKPVKMKVPSVDTVAFNQLPEAIGPAESPVVAVFTRVTGEAPGNMLFILELNQCRDLLKTLMNVDLDLTDGLHLNAMQQSAVEEIGNILASSYINSLSQFTHIPMAAQPPAFAVDMLGAVLNLPIQEAVRSQDYVLLIETLLLVENSHIRGTHLYLPEAGSLGKILNAIGVKA